MNKTELIQAVADAAGLTKKDSEAAVKAVFETITAAMKKNDKVSLIGFGTFGVKERAAREALNPQTKKKIKIAACKVPYFKPGKALKEEVNKKGKKK